MTKKVTKRKTFLNRKRLHIFVLQFSMLLCFLTQNTLIAGAHPLQPPHMDGVKAAVLYDMTSGEFLYEYNPDELRPPASMTKMMTLYIVMDALKAGHISLEDQVTASEYADWTIGSGIRVKEGEVFSVGDLIYALMLPSANDGAVMLAEHIAGTEERFALKMNQKAKSIGLSPDVQFINASGLPRDDLGPYQPKAIIGETQISARDTALLAAALLRDHPEVLEITNTPFWHLEQRDEKPFYNSNWMLAGVQSPDQTINPFEYEGMDGLKTGYTQAAGQSFTGTAVRDGIRLITVVMGAETVADRFHKTRELLDYGFAQYGMITILEAGAQLRDLPTVTVKNSLKKSVKVALLDDVQFHDHLYRTPEAYEIVIDYARVLPLEAPVMKGEKIGEAIITYKDQVERVDLVVTEDAEPLTVFERLLQASLSLFFALFEKMNDTMTLYGYRSLMAG